MDKIDLVIEEIERRLAILRNYSPDLQKCPPVKLELEYRRNELSSLRDFIDNIQEEKEFCKDCEYYPGDGKVCLMGKRLIEGDSVACDNLNIPH